MPFPPSLPPFLSGKYYDTKHMIPYHRNRGGKLSNVNFPLEEIHIEAPAKVRREGGREEARF